MSDFWVYYHSDVHFLATFDPRMPYRAQRLAKSVKMRPRTIRKRPIVGIVMGSVSDAETMKAARDILKEFGVPHEFRVVSAHRTPDLMFAYASQAASRGLKVIIAGAGGAAHLPGMIASKTILPVIGVPVQSRALHGLDSLLSIAQMPSGVPVATVAIGNATNAGLLAVRILATGDPDLQARLESYVEAMRERVLNASV